MSTVLIIGAGGVSNVTVQKCARLPETFTKIVLASRTLARCEEIRARCVRPIEIARVDADNVAEMVQLIKKVEPELVVNLALPYQDLPIMDACLETGVDYLDTANYEPRDEAKFCYKWQWEYQERFFEKGIMALLGSGFDPGVTNVFCAYAQKHLFDSISTIDIIDANAGSHGHPFATNFNPEINIREITQRGKYYENGEWKETAPLEIHTTYDFPEGIGPREMYLLYHEEMESLALNIAGVKRMRFWMTFGQEYITHLRVLQNVGMTRIDPVEYEGHHIIPLQFLKKVLPDPGTLGATYEGKTCIGCLLQGKKDGTDKIYYIYNVCDHAACYEEVQSQAISYTTGVPAMIGAKLMLEKIWHRAGVVNMETCDPDPFMALLNAHGLPWKIVELNKYPATLDI